MTERRVIDEKSLAILEFPPIREILAGFTSFSASRELAVALRPGQNYAHITLRLQQSAEARQFLTLEPHFGIGSVIDIREASRLASLEGMLEPQTLLEIQQTLSALHDLRSRLGKLAEEFPLLWEIAGGITELKQIEKDIAACIDPSGKVLDAASPTLASIRQQMRENRRQILERLEAIIRSPRGQRLLQEDIITEREGRYVILVKVESRHEIKGIVHDISNTGATVFVEPTATVGLGNALRELVIEERREVERILGILSAEVGTNYPEICRNIELTAEIDLTLAKARYARRAKCVEPQIIPPDASGNAPLSLVEARHPLLGEKAVPFSVEIGRDYNVLVITGPNTGGKTVTLKTIGLLGLMAQAGLPIPASGESRLPILDGVFADIGDEQSIEQTLSTFSWHMGNIVRIVRGATAKSLVLLDELGTSTDPAEGAALARAILQYLQARGTLTVATTHYSDLKAFAHTAPGFENASLDFDPATMAPTYHLTVGIPGGSNAMATAARLGLPEEIIKVARGMLSAGSQEVETLLAGLMQEKQKAQALQSELAAEKDRLARETAALEQKRQRLDEEERKAIREAKDRIVSEAAELHREIRQATAELRKDRSAARLEQARQSLAGVREQLDSEQWEIKGGETDANNEIISIGDTVRLKEAGMTATVLAVLEDTQEVEVQAGRTKMRLGLDSVVKTGDTPEIITRRAAPATRYPTRSASLELDLRGKRADEVEPVLDGYLSDVVQANLGQARIIHGYGTGTVRQIVRDFLANHPLVKSFRSGERDEGGDGVTVVSF